MFNFEENKVVTDINNVPAEFHSFYEKQDADADDSPYSLKQGDPTVSAAVNLATGLHQALVKERKNKPAAVDLTPLQEYGSDPAAIAEGFNKKVQALEAQVKDGGAFQKQVEEMKQSMTQAHAQALAERDEANAALTEQLDNYMLDTEIAVAASKFPGLDPKLIKPFARQHLKVDVDGETGQRAVIVLDRDGNTRFSMERPTERASVGELLADMSKQETYLRLFPSDARRGADTKPNAGPGRRPASQGENLTPGQKIARGLSQRR